MRIEVHLEPPAESTAVLMRAMATGPCARLLGGADLQGDGGRSIAIAELQLALRRRIEALECRAPAPQ